jgi:predicted lipid-binding transport protein (Tim44 family)
VTRGQVLLLGLALLGGGLGGLAVFQASGFEGFSAGIAASVLLLLVIVGWTGTYLLRVVTGTMTFSEQRRRYRVGYEAATDAALEQRFASLSPAEQERLLAEIAAADPGTTQAAATQDSATSDPS